MGIVAYAWGSDAIKTHPTAHQWCVFVHFAHFSAHFLPLYATNDVTLHKISLEN